MLKASQVLLLESKWNKPDEIIVRSYKTKNSQEESFFQKDSSWKNWR